MNLLLTAYKFANIKMLLVLLEQKESTQSSVIYANWAYLQKKNQELCRSRVDRNLWLNIFFE